MSRDWVSDIVNMHDHYEMTNKFHSMDSSMVLKNLEFRTKFLQEELDELKDSISAEDVVDALIDICVVAIGTLHALDVDAHKAWDEVLKANMAKEPGVKENRPNPLGLPDLMKPEGWVAPSHKGNHGMLTVKPAYGDCEI